MYACTWWIQWSKMESPFDGVCNLFHKATTINSYAFDKFSSIYDVYVEKDDYKNVFLFISNRRNVVNHLNILKQKSGPILRRF